ncbi:tRNA (guanine-N(7)-)-methyltransferase non-catalytic subunit trm82 [Xanthoria parietina]
MPKRPCAIAFTPDHARIICGDKFGDVYALPLLCNDSRKEALSPVESDDTAQERDTTKNPFVPSATLRTVHTQRNQEALRHQQNQKNQKTSKHAVDFERELLFGHVSLLTDLICLSIPRKPFANTQDRTYIISADRDEHIRVSRGMPQAHIIEGYCLGHTQFVSRLCIPGWDPQLLISGGGDDYLLVWDWLSNRVLHKIDLRKLTIDYVEQQCSSRSVQERESEVAITDVQRNGPIAVSGIFALEVKSSSGDFRRQIAVVCEDVPAIFFFDACKDGNLLHVSTMPTDAALIALALSSDHSRIAYAIVVSQGTLSHPDLAVEDGSSKGTSIGILEYDALKGSWERNEGLVNTVDSAAGSVPALMDGIKGGQAGSESFLNSLETLRKRGRDEYDLV